MILSNPGLAKPTAQAGHRLAQARVQAAAVRAVELRRQSERLLARAQALQQITADARREQWSSPAARKRLQRSEYARLLARAQALQQIIADARREQWSSPAARKRLQRSEYARLLARLETMPVIEQAKGIIMLGSHCGEAEAFDMLRRASQRSNVPVRDLAAQIVAKAAGTAPPTPGPDRQGPTSRQAGTRPLRAG